MESVVEILMEQYITESFANISIDYKSSKKVKTCRGAEVELAGKANNLILKLALSLIDTTIGLFMLL